MEGLPQQRARVEDTGRCRSQHPGRTGATAERGAGATAVAVREKEREAQVVDGVTAGRTAVAGGMAIVGTTVVGVEESGAGTIAGAAAARTTFMAINMTQ